MWKRHQVGEPGWSDADGACVRDRILGRLLDDSVVIGRDNKNVAAPEVGELDEDGAAAHDNLHQQLITINTRQKL